MVGARSNLLENVPYAVVCNSYPVAFQSWDTLGKFVHKQSSEEDFNEITGKALGCGSNNL